MGKDVFNLRLMSSIILALMLTAGLFLNGITGGIIFLVFGIIIAFFSVAEFSFLLFKAGIGNRSVITEVFTVILVTGNIIFCKNDKEAIYFTTLLSSVFVVFCYLHILFSKNSTIILKQITNSVTSYFMTVIPLNFINFIYLMGEGTDDNIGKKYVLFLIAVTKSGDIGGYVAGTLSMKIMKNGNHKIVPFISPKKSWEGTAGGLIFSVIVSYFLGISFFKGYAGFEPIMCFAIGFLLYIGGFLGDISESSLKRIAGVKDSGNIIPGIGGVLDVVDSLLLNAPLFYFYLIFIR